MGTAYFVDFENVGQAGLTGLNVLNKKDKVILFYHDGTINLPLSHMVSCIQATMKSEHFEIKKIASNYLDFQLTTYLGYYAAKHPKKRLVIVSKDNDFIPVIDFWTDAGRTIQKQETILGISLEAVRLDSLPEKPPKDRDALTDAIKKQIRELVKTEDLTVNDYAVIYDALLKNSRNISFREKLEQKIYHHKGKKVGILLSEVHRLFWSAPSIEIPLPPQKTVLPKEEMTESDILEAIKHPQKSAFSKSVRKGIRESLKGLSLGVNDLAAIYLALELCQNLEECQHILQQVVPQNQGIWVFQRTQQFFKKYHGIE